MGELREVGFSEAHRQNRKESPTLSASYNDGLQTFVTMTLEAGGSARTLQRWLDHADLS